MTDPGAQEVQDGSPALIEGLGYSIKFQLGPVAEVGVNGTTIEEILGRLRTRLEGFQRGQFKCRENAEAMAAIEDAIAWLEARTSARKWAGVEGQNNPHPEGGQPLPGGVIPRLDANGERVTGGQPAAPADEPAVVTAARKVVESPGFVGRAGKGKLSLEEQDLVEALKVQVPGTPAPETSAAGSDPANGGA